MFSDRTWFEIVSGSSACLFVFLMCQNGLCVKRFLMRESRAGEVCRSWLSIGEGDNVGTQGEDSRGLERGRYVVRCQKVA